MNGATDSKKSPVEIINSQEKGRCFIATADLQVGASVHSAEPFAKIVDQNSKGRVCNYCVQEPDSSSRQLSLTCPKSPSCSAHYCSHECLEKDAKAFHSVLCSYTPSPATELSNYAKDYFELLATVLYRMHSDPEHFHIPHIEGMWFDLKLQTPEQIKEYTLVALELEKLINERMNTFKYPEVDAGFVDLLSRYVGQSYGNRFAYLYSIISKEECNSFGLYTFLYDGHKEHRQGFGLALYPSAVYFNHGCDPNIGRYYASNGNMEFFAIKEIKEGQEALITYIDTDLAIANRKMTLKDHFHFDCTCTRCISEESNQQYNFDSKLILCGEEECKGSFKPLSSAKWKCIACQKMLAL